MSHQLIPALVDGGLGIRGISQTPFYVFINSQEGLSQLGIRPQDPPKLLEAYRRMFKVKISGNTIELQFGNVHNLKLATPHFASGTGRLKIKSWLEWIVDGRTEPFGYVPRASLPKGMHKNIRLSSPLGGLMLKAGQFRSSGFWSIPKLALGYDVAWVQQNQPAIERAMEHAIVKILTRQFGR
jgi:hypothetical protein